MRGEQAIFNLEIKKKSGSSINSNIHHSKVFSSDGKHFWYFKLRLFDRIYSLKYLRSTTLGCKDKDAISFFAKGAY